MSTVSYACLILYHVLSAVSVNLHKDHDLFILTNRDANGTFALSKPAANINNASTMRDVTAGIEKYDEWYLINDTIANNKYNNTTLQLWALEEQVHVHVGVWNYTPQDDGTWQIFAKGFFLGLDEENTTQPILHPLADFGKSGFGFWSMIALPTVFVTRTVWVTSSRFVAAKTSFLGGRVTSILTLSVTETQYYVRRDDRLWDVTTTQVMPVGSTQDIPQKKQIAKASFKLPTITSITTITSLESTNVSVGWTTVSDAMTIGLTTTTAVDTVSFSDLPTSTKKNGGDRLECSLFQLIFLGVTMVVGGNLV